MAHSSEYLLVSNICLLQLCHLMLGGVHPENASR